MSTYLRFRFGPFVSYKRLGRTAAQKKAAGKAREQREKARTSYLMHGIVRGTVDGKLQVKVTDGGGTVFDGYTILVGYQPGFQPGQEISMRVSGDSKVQDVRLAATR